MRTIAQPQQEVSYANHAPNRYAAPSFIHKSQLQEAEGEGQGCVHVRWDERSKTMIHGFEG